MDRRGFMRGAIALLTCGAPLALLGDDPEREELLAWFREYCGMTDHELALAGVAALDTDNLRRFRSALETTHQLMRKAWEESIGRLKAGPNPARGWAKVLDAVRSPFGRVGQVWLGP